jgi:hypothetical protein
MHINRVRSRSLAGIVLLSLLTLFLAGCGNSSSATGSAPASAPAPTNCPALATGTLKSISGTTLLIDNQQGKQVQAIVNSSTIFTRETQLTRTALKEGTGVSVRTIQNPDNSYSAQLITIRNTSTGTNQGGFSGFPGAREHQVLEELREHSKIVPIRVLPAQAAVLTVATEAVQPRPAIVTHLLEV